MTINGSDRTELVCTCDECGQEEFAGTLEFRPFLKWLKEQGWQTRKDESGHWAHHCPDCAE